MPTKNIRSDAEDRLQQLHAEVKLGNLAPDTMAMMIAGDPDLAIAAAKNEQILLMRFDKDNNVDYPGNEGYPMAWAVAYDKDAAIELMLKNPGVLESRCGKDERGATVWHLIAREHSSSLLEILKAESDAEGILKLDYENSYGEIETVAETLIANAIDCIDEVLLFVANMPKLLAENPSIKEAIGSLLGDRLDVLSEKVSNFATGAKNDELMLAIRMYLDLKRLIG